MLNFNIFPWKEASSHCQDLQSASSEQFLSPQENEAALFIKLFEEALKDNQWIENNLEQFEAIAAKIRTLEEGNRFDGEQLQKIESVCRDALLLPSCRHQIDSILLKIHQPALSLKQALDALLCDKSGYTDALSNQCLDFIREKTGLTIKPIENGVLEFKGFVLMDEIEACRECIDSFVFRDVIGACFRLSENLGFKCDINRPDIYSEFLIGLIQMTAKVSSKNWQKGASALPVELCIENKQHSNIRDAVDDFIKTVFLAYRIQSMQDYQTGSAKKLFDQTRLDMITMFLEGVSLGAICELSSHWHEAGRAAQLNKAKTFSKNRWEPLFSHSVGYQLPVISFFFTMFSGGMYTAVPLTSSDELKKEGADLSHCVAGYTNQCLQGNCHIVSLRDTTGKSLSTLEFQLCPGRGREGDPKIINVKGNSEYHLRVNQHSGERNQSPSSLSKWIAGRLFDDMRNGKVVVDLSGLEMKRQERIHALKGKTDISLIGYDPTIREHFEEAKKIYRQHGIRNIAFEKTLIANFDALSGN